MKLLLAFAATLVLFSNVAFLTNATTSYLNLIKKAREKDASLSGKSDQEVMLAMIDQYTRRVNSANPQSNERTVSMSARMPVMQPIQPIQPILQPIMQQTMQPVIQPYMQPVLQQPVIQTVPVNTLPQYNPAFNSGHQEVKSALRPLHMRKMALLDNQRVPTSAQRETLKRLSASRQQHQNQPQQQQFFMDPTFSFTMNSLSPQPSQMLQQQQPHQKFHQQPQQISQFQQIPQSNQLPNMMTMMNGFDQTAANNFMLQQQQQQQQQMMMQNQNQQFGFMNQQSAFPAGTNGGAAGNYFQSNSFSNNPLRKSNDLNKARKEFLTDPKFLRDQPKLSNFLFAKYLKEVSTDEKLPETTKSPNKPKSLKKTEKKISPKTKPKTKTEEEEEEDESSKTEKTIKEVKETVNGKEESNKEEKAAVKKSSEASKIEAVKEVEKKSKEPERLTKEQKEEIDKKKEKKKTSSSSSAAAEKEDTKSLSGQIQYMGSQEMNDLRSYINDMRKEWTSNNHAKSSL